MNPWKAKPLLESVRATIHSIKGCANLRVSRTTLRYPMAQVDPRQRGLFGAAFMVGIVASTQASSVESLALGAPSGPFGLADGVGVYPAWHCFAAFSRLAGSVRLNVKPPPGIAAAAVKDLAGAALLVANLTGEFRQVGLPQPGTVAVLDRLQPTADWLAAAPRATAATLNLQPFAVAFVSIGPRDFFESSP